ncbi:ABC transporter permease subunit [Kribbella qitaiheensis]|uniref:ABC transporter permease subunit n=1 Tax=Kribbella qitaiheensis TaxID=1544730 RepID=A0A7G6X322_9ACTN|nr:ABC transporter permease subunit [Kribbella qitaiheensis]QNE20637.1 ABC transporter permease subunit [Kribbella qitaiheensis]
MIRLTRVELRRLVSRRLTVIGVAALLLITGVLLFATWNNSKPLSAAEQRNAQVNFEQAQKDWQLNGEQYKKDCEQGWQSQPDPKPKLEEYCRLTPPSLDQFGKPQVKFTEVMPDLLLGSSYLLAFAAFVIGASFVGAEFSSGSISNWLTFEPRRLRVYGSKLVAAATGMLPVAAVALAILLAGTYLIVNAMGSTAGTTGKVWGDLAGTAGRAVVMAAAAGALGGIFALLLRHTAAAVGVAMGYLVLVEGVFGSFLAKAQPWLVKLNFDAWIRHDTTYYVDNCRSVPDGGYSCESIEKTLTFEHGAWYLGIAVVVLIALGAGVFHRRDIT